MRANHQQLATIAIDRAVLSISAVNLAFAAATACVGTAGVLSNMRPADAVLHHSTHAILFGCVLATFVSLRAHWHTRASMGATAPSTRGLVRHLSRLVYLSLYGLFGEAAIFAIVKHRAFAADAENLQGYFLAGILVLIWIRILASQWIRRTARTLAQAAVNSNRT